ncbi:uncharacterized protein [Mycetomoellerius zeteki]|uniref:uncharacterized protein n=1 Tax=Mycetomoellerius zeteki TaxID=64791 RepID=UPI00084E85DE|nr:PREDICTED: uncharacterized protein LOC108726361 [Trachymyrmex zeteki]
MTKITIINCIIAAVYIFQTAEARFFDKSPLDSVQNPISNIIEKVKLGKDGIQNEKVAYDRLTDGLVTPETGLSTFASCINTTNIQQVIEQITKPLNTCIIQKINSTEKLTNLLNNLQNISKLFQDVLNCILKPPLNLTYLNEVVNKVSELASKINETVNAAYEAIGTFPDIGVCFTSEIQKLPDQFINQIIQNLIQCVPNFKLLFKL